MHYCLHLCSIWSTCVPGHLQRWFGQSDHHLSSMCLECIYTCSFMWTNTIQLQSDDWMHANARCKQGLLSAVEWLHSVFLVKSLQVKCVNFWPDTCWAKVTDISISKINSVKTKKQPLQPVCQINTELGLIVINILDQDQDDCFF